ncbi:hypothetical protein BD410DRAFT_5606 [Rickenella mellea]|uniref:Uncharacterized protein n=1 Tax=Rickenella mellea TaxID=50990 RepID=A0A4R5XFN2_9AGAM|nr:hypothetical protein BD410DRAFT_5606 [Rickenella mellea]
MPHDAVTLPNHLSFSLTIPEARRATHIHQTRALWKRVFRSLSRSVSDPELAMTQTQHRQTTGSVTRPTPVDILFVDGEDLVRPVSEVVEAIINPKSSSPGSASAVISRNEISSVIKILKAFLHKRTKAIRTAAWVADQHQVSTAARSRGAGVYPEQLACSSVIPPFIWMDT